MPVIVAIYFGQALRDVILFYFHLDRREKRAKLSAPKKY
jgi:hypothetical protein